MERFIRLDKEDFIGRAASLRLKQRGPRMKLVRSKWTPPTATAWATSPSIRDDRIVGLTTSGGYGHAVEKSLAFAYVKPELARSGTAVEVLVFNERRAARVIADSPWDPQNARLRG